MGPQRASCGEGRHREPLEPLSHMVAQVAPYAYHIGTTEKRHDEGACGPFQPRRRRRTVALVLAWTARPRLYVAAAARRATAQALACNQASLDCDRPQGPEHSDGSSIYGQAEAGRLREHL